MTDDFAFRAIADRGLEPFLEFAFAGRKATHFSTVLNELFLADGTRYKDTDSSTQLVFVELERPMTAEDVFPMVLEWLKKHRPIGGRDEDEDKGWSCRSGSAYGNVILAIKPEWVTYSK